jgi:two-component system phosphate regulon sensor histidine kinase PhoR
VERRWIIGLVATIGMALLGLVGIQVHWIRSTVSARESQLVQGIDNALFVVSDKLEQLERIHTLRNEPAGRQLLLRLDTLRTKRSPDRVGSVDPSRDPGGVIDGSGDDLETLVTDVVRGILAAEMQRDIRDRLDVRVLDSLINSVFLADGLPRPTAYGVFDDGDRPIPLSSDQPDHLERLLNTPYRERLFRHDLALEGYFLRVAVDDERGLIHRGVVPQLIISALFIGLIIAVFAIALRIILRQKRISDIRNDLVNNLTHELKTPISTIGLACEALADPSVPKTDQQVRTFVGMIRDENKRLGALVENVLQSAVLDSGHMVLKLVDLDMHSLVQDVIRSSNIQVSRRSGRIETDLRAEIHHVQGDRIHLTNLLYNLIDNAVKYTRQEPVIRIVTHSNDTGITLSVSDNGIGIAPSEQRKIFDRLYRVPTGNIHNTKGFGLGLSYVRTVVERHRGTIRVESVPGQGSTFHLFIPFEHVITRQAAPGRG